MLGQSLGLLTSRPCDIPLGSAEMVGLEECQEGGALEQGAVKNLFPGCPGSCVKKGFRMDKKSS